MAAHSLNQFLTWHAVRVATLREITTAGHVAARDIEVLCPTYRLRRRYGTSNIAANLALFPSYLFARYEPMQRAELLSTPGVLGVVGFSGSPAAVDPLEIAALQAMMRAGLLGEPVDYLRVGDRVRVRCGAFSGHVGILQRHRGVNRIVISVTLLQRSVAIELPAEALEAA